MSADGGSGTEDGDVSISDASSTAVGKSAGFSSGHGVEVSKKKRSANAVEADVITFEYQGQVVVTEESGNILQGTVKNSKGNGKRQFWWCEFKRPDGVVYSHKSRWYTREKVKGFMDLDPCNEIAGSTSEAPVQAIIETAAEAAADEESCGCSDSNED